MHKITIAILLMLLSVPAQAAEIRVLAPGLVGPAFTLLAQRWSAQTGNSVITPGNGTTVGKIEGMIATGEVDDLVLLPSGEFSGLGDKLKPGSTRPMGHILFGLAVRSGAAHPDISTPEKFRVALAGKSVGYNDPASGSLAGKMVDALLKTPDYAAVKATPAKGLAGNSVAAGTLDMAIAVEPEEVAIKGIDIVGPVPDGIGLHIDIAGAVLANAAHPDVAAAFLAYLTSPENAAIWKSNGVAP